MRIGCTLPTGFQLMLGATHLHALATGPTVRLQNPLCVATQDTCHLMISTQPDKGSIDVAVSYAAHNATPIAFPSITFADRGKPSECRAVSRLLRSHPGPADPNLGADGKRHWPQYAEGARLVLLPGPPSLAGNLQVYSHDSPELVPCILTTVVQVSERVLATDEPVIGKTKALMQGVDGVLSLAQGPSAPHH